MIISKTPYRMSFFGGGTDYPAWYLKEGGEVLSTTIDKYCYISCRYLPPFFNIKHRIVWSHIETVSTISEILHPAVREGLRFLGFDDSSGLEIHHQGDLPARAGMGTSSAFTVGLINALTTLQCREVTTHELALKAIQVEQMILRESVGSQDQVAVTYGGLNRIRFFPGGKIEVEALRIDESRARELESRLLLFYTGTSRMGPEIAAKVVAELHDKSKSLLRMREMVGEAIELLHGKEDLSTFGLLLDEGWKLKRGISREISNSRIDDIYGRGIRAGALGGKLLGAGASGFMVFYASKDRHSQIVSALSDCLHVPFGFESAGSTIIDYQTRRNEIVCR